MTNPNPECPREDCKFIVKPDSTIIGTNTRKTYITSITLHNPIKPPTCIIECFTCGMKWEGTLENGITTYKNI